MRFFVPVPVTEKLKHRVSLAHLVRTMLICFLFFSFFLFLSLFHSYLFLPFFTSFLRFQAFGVCGCSRLPWFPSTLICMRGARDGLYLYDT